MKIKLLQNYKEYNLNEIISVNNQIALDLIKKNIAIECTNRDFLIKPQFGISKAFKRKVN